MELFETYIKVINTISEKYNRKEPFLFALNFDKTQGFCFDLQTALERGIRFSINEHAAGEQIPGVKVTLQYKAAAYSDYFQKFMKVKSHLLNGDTYLLNLTQETPIEINIELEDIYNRSIAPYRLYVPDYFAVFSPEMFVRIENGVIVTKPMKGTISGDDPRNVHTLKMDPKENAEHNTIVDLLRNDLSIVAENVFVKNLKYIEQIKTHAGSLYQMSSEITGTIRPYFKQHLGDLIDSLLPAGSVSGAPKLKTLSIIHEIEAYNRGFYTGIFGYFDGYSLKSAVMIRFIEKRDNKYYYKSGGGLTAMSDPEAEYKELLQKIYVPIF